MTMAAPYTSQEFAREMAALGLTPGDGPFAVATSGGPDSMALALLFAGWGKATYLIFDHGLRDGSAAEARQVGQWLENKGYSHKILTWQGAKPTSDIQARARAARYQALEGWCRSNGVTALLLGHTHDDQAETFFMRLLRGSGVDGLAAMAAVAPPVSDNNGPKLVRPLLGVAKARLKEFLNAEGQDYITDPSNENPAFLRVQVRRLLAASDIEGFNADTLVKTASRMARVKRVLDSLTREVLKTSLQVFDEGYGRLDTPGLLAAPEEIGLRALSKALVAFGGGRYPPRLEKLERLYQALKAKDFSGATLAGCQIFPDHDGFIYFCREASEISQTLSLSPGEKAIWDRRFEVSLKAGGTPGEVRALGESGWTSLVQDHPGLKQTPIPFPVKVGLPALFSSGEVVEVPHLHFPASNGHLAISGPVAAKLL